MSTSKPKGFFSIILVLIIGITAAVLFLRQDKPAEEQQTADTAFGGEIIFTQGTVERGRPDGDWQRVNEGTSLEEGDSVEVMDNGKAIVKLDDGSVVRLNENSSLTLTSLDPNHIIITNNKGELYSRVVKLDRTFQVQAGKVTYESMGTAYKTIKTEKENGVEVYESKVKVINGTIDVEVEEGNKYYDAKTGDFDSVRVVLPITEADLEDDFTAWNLEKDTDIAVTPTEQEEEKEDAKITLVATEDGAISWETNIESEKGFKVVWSKSQNPTYPTRASDKYQYFSEPSTRSAKIDAFNGTARYYVRVCEYLGGECGTYSNEATVNLTEEKTDKEEGKKDEVKDNDEKEEKDTDEANKGVSKINLSASGANLSWGTTGTSEKGFKIVWSKTQGPTYPTRSTDKYKYLSSSNSSAYTITPFDGDGTYYVRVCEYSILNITIRSRKRSIMVNKRSLRKRLQSSMVKNPKPNLPNKKHRQIHISIKSIVKLSNPNNIR